MSFTQDDRKVQSKTGKDFPPDAGQSETPFAAAIAAALSAEFGDTPSAIKTVARLTRSNERAVRNWFNGKNGPSGGNLMSLMRHSDVVLTAVMTLSHRRELAVSADLHRLRRHLSEVIAIIDGAPASIG